VDGSLSQLMQAQMIDIPANRNADLDEMSQAKWKPSPVKGLAQIVNQR